MTAVITIQGLLFQDGGLLVMGWNLLNMGVFTAFTGYAVYAALRRMLGIQPRARLIAVFIASWFSVEVGAVATAFELAASGTSPIQFGLPAMMAVHALIGVGEGLITMGAVSLLLRARPEVLSEGETAPGRGWANVVSAGLLLAVVVGSLAPFASASPDGLERVAQDQGFMVLSEGSGGGIFADYALPWIEDQHLATILAVIGGTIIIFGLVLLLARGIVRPWGSKE
jgi:cobalt/nickel transport system permease protein